MSFSIFFVFSSYSPLFQRSSFLAATLPRKTFLIKLLWTVVVSIWHPNEATRSLVSFLLDFPWSPPPPWPPKKPSEKLIKSRFFFSIVRVNFFVFDFSWFFKFLYKSLKNTSTYSVCLLISPWKWLCWCKIPILFLSNSEIFGILNGMM